jgi:hypothetical protein
LDGKGGEGTEFFSNFFYSGRPAIQFSQQQNFSAALVSEFAKTRDGSTAIYEKRDGIIKLLRSPVIDSKESLRQPM